MPGVDETLPECDDVEGDAFCVEDQEQAVDDIAVYVGAVAGTGVTAEKPTDGKSIFAATCGSCHTLADAGTTGAVGPNLDQSKPPKALVIDRVTNGQGAMPSFKDSLDQQQIEAVAEYVSVGRRQVAAALTALALGLEIDDDVRHRHVEARSRTDSTTPRSSQFDFPGGMRGDTISFGLERPDGVVDGDERIDVADVPSPRSRPSARRSRVASSRSCAGARRRILVGGLRLEPRVQRRADDAELRLLRQRERADRAQQLLAGDGLVRDDEDAALIRAAELLDLRGVGRPARAARK